MISKNTTIYIRGYLLVCFRGLPGLLRQCDVTDSHSDIIKSGLNEG